MYFLSTSSLVEFLKDGILAVFRTLLLRKEWSTDDAVGVAHRAAVHGTAASSTSGTVCHHSLKANVTKHVAK